MNTSKVYKVEVDDEEPFAKTFDIRERPGYFGAHTTQNAPGAMPAGTRIVKAVDEPGDMHTVGDEGVVLGSIPVQKDAVPISKRFGYIPFLYWVEYDDNPKVAVGIVSAKIKAKA